MNYLLTGGTGSLGQALARHLLKDENCTRVVVFSRDEWKQSQMAAGLAEHEHASRARFFLGDVRDPDRLRQALQGIDVVIHAAALKRVDAVAYNPGEVIKTNILGTINVIGAAVEAGVKKVMVVSSDKAVHPTNIYGISKAAAEHYAVASNAFAYPQGTKVSCVRYGNVLGSRGSVVHIFRDALAAEKPLPITDPRCTRFWLTMSQAVDFVLKAVEKAEGGEIAVPVLPSSTVMELGRAISGSGFCLGTGLRPGGEKLHESLLTDEELTRTVRRSWALLVKPAVMSWRADEPWGFLHTDLKKYNSLTNRWKVAAWELRGMLEGEGLL